MNSLLLAIQGQKMRFYGSSTVGFSPGAFGFLFCWTTLVMMSLTRAQTSPIGRPDHSTSLYKFSQDECANSYLEGHPWRFQRVVVQEYCLTFFLSMNVWGVNIPFGSFFISKTKIRSWHMTSPTLQKFEVPHLLFLADPKPWREISSNCLLIRSIW